MAKQLLRRGLNLSLVSTDDESRTAIARLKPGDELWVEFRKVRNPKHHRLYFALLHTVFDNQERYTSFTHFRAAVQMAAGHVEWIPGLDGVAVPIPKSVDYTTLDENEFTQVFNETMTVCLREFLQGTEMEYLRAEVMRYAA